MFINLADIKHFICLITWEATPLHSAYAWLSNFMFGMPVDRIWILNWTKEICGLYSHKLLQKANIQT